MEYNNSIYLKLNLLDSPSTCSQYYYSNMVRWLSDEGGHMPSLAQAKLHRD